ncbi:MAG: hypothetical protein HY054_13845 [Proteobacteria bacterium]|nr:hypothetical protein [Pseudomonadota bacterium]
MTFILRWPAILVLLALVILSFAAAFVATVALGHLPIDLSKVLGPSDIETLRSTNWIQAGLLYGAGLFFLISAIRLMRRTQGFWTWLLGFACFGGRWALAQQENGGLVGTVQHINPNAYLQPQTLIASPGAPEAQVALLGAILLVGLLILIVDAADRAHWDRQGA